MTSTWEEGFVELNGAQMHFYRGGTRGKPPLVLAHGFSDMGLCWEALARELENEFDIYMPDARGHGLSARVQSGEKTDMPADLAGVMRALEIRGAVVAGHSMGGVVVGQLAARFPDLVRALVLEDPAWFLPEPQGEAHGIGEGPMGEWVKSLAVKSSTELMAECRAEHPNWPEIVVQRWCEGKKQLDQNFPSARDAAWTGWTAVVRSIQCPALLVTADPELGGIITPETGQKIIEMNPQFQIAHISGVGHHIRFGMEQAYTHAVKAFLASLN
jgi:N-formylmaleamate deformylase